MAKFSPMKCKDFITLLEQLGYTIDRQKGSHRQLKAPGRNRISLSYAEGSNVPPGVIRKNLVQQAGLKEDVAAAFVEGRWKPERES